MEAAAVTREVVLDATLEEVWRALTDAGELSAWFGAEVRLDPKPGGGGTFVEGATVRRAEVESVEDGRRLAFRWWPEGEADAASLVEFTVAEADEGTRLTVVESIPAGLEPTASACASASSAAAPCSLGDTWDDRLLGLELRCLSIRLAGRLVGA